MFNSHWCRVLDLLQRHPHEHTCGGYDTYDMMCDAQPTRTDECCTPTQCHPEPPRPTNYGSTAMAVEVPSDAAATLADAVRLAVAATPCLAIRVVADITLGAMVVLKLPEDTVLRVYGAPHGASLVATLKCAAQSRDEGTVRSGSGTPPGQQDVGTNASAPCRQAANESCLHGELGAANQTQAHLAGPWALTSNTYLPAPVTSTGVLGLASQTPAVKAAPTHDAPVGDAATGGVVEVTNTAGGGATGWRAEEGGADTSGGCGPRVVVRSAWHSAFKLLGKTRVEFTNIAVQHTCHNEDQRQVGAAIFCMDRYVNRSVLIEPVSDKPSPCATASPRLALHCLGRP